MNHERSSTSESSHFQDDLEKLKDDLAHLRDDLGDLMNSVVSAGRSRVGEVRQRMQSEVSDQVGRMRDCRQQATQSVQRQFESHPVLAVGAAFGLGVILGSMLRRDQ